MTERTTFTLDSEAFAFLKQAAGNNRSAFVNQLIKDEKKRLLEQEILRANQEESQDSDYQKELVVWHTTLSDGLSA